MVAGRVYRAVLDEWVQRAMTTPRPGGGPPDVEARSRLELIERLGPWSLRWQEAQDNAARSRAARYQALSDHLGRMSALEDGRFLRETGQAAGGPVEPKPPRVSAEVARFFRPIDEWDIDRIVPDAPPVRAAAQSPGRRRHPRRAGRDRGPGLPRDPGRRGRPIPGDHRATARRAGRRARSSTPCSPSGWGSGRTSGGNPRTSRPGLRPRDRPRCDALDHVGGHDRARTADGDDPVAHRADESPGGRPLRRSTPSSGPAARPIRPST